MPVPHVPPTEEQAQGSRERGAGALSEILDLFDQAGFNLSETQLASIQTALAALEASGVGANPATGLLGLAGDAISSAQDTAAAVEAFQDVVDNVPAANLEESLNEAGQAVQASQAAFAAASGLLILAAGAVGVLAAATTLISVPVALAVGGSLALAGVGAASLGGVLDAIADRARELINATGNEEKPEEPSPDEQEPLEGQNPPSPLIIDLDGDGVESTPLSSGSGGQQVFFDIDSDGLAERIAFASPDDGLLVLDRNNNGVIDDGSELFPISA